MRIADLKRLSGPINMRNSPHLLAIALIFGSMGAQDRKAASLPIWPEDGRIAPEYAGSSVFITADGHAVVVLAPESPDLGMTGPRKTIKVPLKNDLAPAVSVTVKPAGAERFTYEYAIENGANARDSIGAWSLIVPAGDSRLEVMRSSGSGQKPWSGAAATVPIARQAILPSAPPGRYLLWFHQADDVIRPGQTRNGFSILSYFRPGLTTAWFSSGELLDFDQSWPPPIFRELELLEDRQWREKFVITVGPVFAPDTPRTSIAERLQTDVASMIKSGRLDPSSPFTIEVQKTLGELTRPSRPSEQHTMRAAPRTKTEAAVAAALQFSLEVNYDQRP